MAPDTRGGTPRFAPHVFSVWDGTQDPLGDDTSALFDRLSEDVFHGWDFETALRRLLSQGWRDRQGRRFTGLEEMMEQLRRRRQQQLERFSLDNVFKDIEEKLDNVLRLERAGIEQRLQGADDERAHRILERVARKRRETLDNLPPDAAGAIRQLQDYEFIDADAEQAFARLLEEIKKGVVDTYFKEMTAQLQQMSEQDMAVLRGMELLSDRGTLGQRYSFFGSEQLPLDEAMQVMDRLQSIEELERALRGVYRGETMDERTRESLGELLGEDAARDLDRVQRITEDLER